MLRLLFCRCRRQLGRWRLLQAKRPLLCSHLLLSSLLGSRSGAVTLCIRSFACLRPVVHVPKRCSLRLRRYWHRSGHLHPHVCLLRLHRTSDLPVLGWLWLVLPPLRTTHQLPSSDLMVSSSWPVGHCLHATSSALGLPHTLSACAVSQPGPPCSCQCRTTPVGGTCWMVPHAMSITLRARHCRYW